MLNPEHWDECTRGAGPWLSRGYFRALEQSAPGNVDLRFVLIYDGATPLTALCLQLVEMTGPQSSETLPPAGESARHFSRVMRRHLRTDVSPVRARRALVCGDVFVCRPVLMDRPSVDRTMLWQGVTEVVQRVFEQEKMCLTRDFILIKDTLPDDLAALGVLRERSYQRLRVESDYVLPLSSKWECYSDYVDSLKPLQRKAVNKLHRDKQDVGLTSRLLRTADDLGKLESMEIRPLHGANLFPSTWKYGEFVHALLRECFLSSSALRIHQINGMPVAFTLVVRDQGSARNHLWGLCGNQKVPACLGDAMLQGAVEDAIQLGCRVLHLGRTGAHEKARLGAQPAPREAWVAHRNAGEAVDLAPLFRVVNHEPHLPGSGR